MVTRSDWTIAYVNGFAVRTSERTLDCGIAASYKIFGVADWSARLPIALCVLALAVIVFFFGRKLFVWNAAGLYAALIFLTWPGTFVATRDLTPAPLLCVETTLIAFALWHLLIQKGIAGWTGVGVSAAACILTLLTAPWPAVALPAAIAVACWISRRRGQKPTRWVEWPLMAWAAAAFIFGYLLEAQPHNPLTWINPVPPLAMLIGGWLANKEAFSEPANGRRLPYAIFVIGLLVSALLVLLALHHPFDFAFHYRSMVITAPATRIPLFILAATLIAGVTGNLIFQLRGKVRVANCFLAGMLGGVTVSIQAGLVMASPFFSSQILADAIRPELAPTDIVVVDAKYPEASSFAFYLERPVSLALSHDLSTPQTPSAAVALDQIWNGANRVYLWTKIDHPFPVPSESYVVAASGGKEILSNQPNSGGASF